MRGQQTAKAEADLQKKQQDLKKGADTVVPGGKDNVLKVGSRAWAGRLSDKDRSYATKMGFSTDAIAREPQLVGRQLGRDDLFNKDDKGNRTGLNAKGKRIVASINRQNAQKAAGGKSSKIATAMKNPKLRDKILKARKNGYSDSEIEAGL